MKLKKLTPQQLKDLYEQEMKRAFPPDELKPLKAMEHLQDLNSDKKTASRPMVTFLVLNTAGVTLISTNIIAYRQASGSIMSTQYIPYAILSTLMASIAGLLLDRWWNYRKS